MKDIIIILAQWCFLLTCVAFSASRLLRDRHTVLELLNGSFWHNLAVIYFIGLPPAITYSALDHLITFPTPLLASVIPILGAVITATICSLSVDTFIKPNSKSEEKK